MPTVSPEFEWRFLMKLSKAYHWAWALILLAIPLAAQMNPKRAKICSLATLDGSYGFFGQGTVVTQPPVQTYTCRRTAQEKCRLGAARCSGG